MASQNSTGSMRGFAGGSARLVVTTPQAEMCE